MKLMSILTLTALTLWSCNKQSNSTTAEKKMPMVKSGKFETFKIQNTESEVEFKIMKFKIGADVEGKFTKFNGQFDYSKDASAISNVMVNIETASINTENEKRDGHLRSEDFFDSANHKDMSFKAVGPFAIEGGKAVVMGDLTIKGNTKPITVTMDLKEDDGAVKFDGKAIMEDRKEWGVTWNKVLDQGGFVLDDKVRIELEGKATKL